VAREVEISMVVKLKDAASAGLSRLSSIAKGFGNGIKASLSGAFSALKAIPGAFTPINQGLEIAKKGLEFIKLGYESLIAPALEWRSQSDQQAKDFKKLQNTFQEIATLIGDILIPVVLGIADAYRDTIKEAMGFLKTNKELIASGIAEWLVKIGQFLVNVVAKGIIYVTRIWSGWVELINTIKFLAASFFSMYMEYLDKVLSGIQKVAEFMGQKGLAAGIAQARGAIQNLGKSADEAGDGYIKKVHEQIRAQDEMEAGINRVAETVNKGFGKIVPAVMKRVREEIHKVNPAAKEAYDAALAHANESLRKQRLAYEYQAQIRQYHMDREMENLERLAEMEELHKQKVMEIADEIGVFTGSIADGITEVMAAARQENADIFESIKQGLKTVGKTFATEILNMAEKYVKAKIMEAAAEKASATGKVTAKAASAAAGAAESQSSIPILGPALAIAASVAMFALVKGFIQGFASGGVVKGVGDTDSVLIKAMPNELYLDKKASRALVTSINGGHSPPVMADDSSPRHGGGGDTVIKIASYVLPTKQQLVEAVRDNYAPGAKRLKRLMDPEFA